METIPYEICKIILSFVEQYWLVRAKRVCRKWRNMVNELYPTQKEELPFTFIIIYKAWLFLKTSHINYNNTEDVMSFGDNHFVEVWFRCLPNLDVNLCTLQASCNNNIPIAIKLLNEPFISNETVYRCLFTSYNSQIIAEAKKIYEKRKISSNMVGKWIRGGAWMYLTMGAFQRAP